MALFLFLGNQGIAAVQILLDEGILNLRDTLFQFPVIRSFHGHNSGSRWFKIESEFKAMNADADGMEILG